MILGLSMHVSFKSNHIESTTYDSALRNSLHI